jgi:uncharacterized cofD-like protein
VTEPTLAGPPAPDGAAQSSDEPDLPSLKGPLPGPGRPTDEVPQWKRRVRWFTPGIGIKRWALLALLGIALAATGALLAAAYLAVEWSVSLVERYALWTQHLLNTEALGAALLLAGIVCVLVGTRGVMKAVERVYAASGQVREGFLETALRQKQLEGKQKIVALGGGTGLSTMLRGLKNYSSNITAIVTMADDGGSSGMLREHGMLPPGDLRNCIAALAESEPLMVQLFQHRFEGLGELKGHSLGNLIMAAMCEMEGDYESAVRATSKVLAIRGRVLPSTLDDVRLGAILADGSEVLGQVSVNKSRDIRQAFLVPESPRALPDAVRAIEDADVIIIGPGSLFTSIIPNLLVPEIAAAIKRSRAPKIYVCNVMTQPGESSGFKASDHVSAIIRHIGQGVITHVLVNRGHVKPNVLERYKEVGAEYVEPDEDAIEMLGVRPIHGNFIDDSNLVRHHSAKLAAHIFKIIAKI